MDDGDASVLSVIGALNLGLDCFREHLQELEHMISNAARCCCCTWRLQYFPVKLWWQKRGWLDRCRLSAVSLACLAKGP